MMDDLKFSKDPKQVELTLDNCTLLPQHTVKDIIREGDTIHLKTILVASKKRKQGKWNRRVLLSSNTD
ncbi:hypothetical protein G6F68_020867 [Rhizopus microsporus]|nr:hypothetical protein G6F68_020867 [Rhizopus microsporus]